MIMGNKIVKTEDALIILGAYVLPILKNKSMPLDNLYAEFINKYPKKNISFEHFIYTLDFLFMIKKIDIENDDILKIVL